MLRDMVEHLDGARGDDFALPFSGLDGGTEKTLEESRREVWRHALGARPADTKTSRSEKLRKMIEKLEGMEKKRSRNKIYAPAVAPARKIESRHSAMSRIFPKSGNPVQGTSRPVLADARLFAGHD